MALGSWPGGPGRVEADELALDFEHDSFADYLIGNLIAVAVIRELAIFVHFAENLEGGIVIHQRKVSQTGDLLFPAARNGLPMGPMDSLVGGFFEPNDHIPVGLGERGEGIAPPESLPDIVHGTFDFSFDPGTVGRTGFGLKPIVMGKVEEFHVKNRLPVLPAQDDIFHVVVGDLGGNPLKKMESVDMAVQEGFQGAAFHQLDIHGPGIPQEHDQSIKRKSFPIRFLHLEISPIHLGL